MSRIDGGGLLEAGLRILLGGVFLGAAVLKILDPLSFADSLARLRVLPFPLLGPVAILLPWVEGGAAVALLGITSYRPAALRLLFALLVVFTLVLLGALARGTAGSCGCFGSEGGWMGRTDVAVVRNLLLLGIAGALLVRRRASAAAARPPS